jgi:hypothetical protein
MGWRSAVVVLVCAVSAACGGELEGSEADELNDSAKGTKKRDAQVGKLGQDDERPVELERDAAIPQHDASAPALQVEHDAGQPVVEAPVIDAAAPALELERDAGEVVPVEADAALPAEPVAACTAQFWLDQDRDGFGVGEPITSCSKPQGYADQPGDCYDANRLVFPQPDYYSNNQRGDGSYDYNCDGEELSYWRAPAVSCPEFTAEDHACPPGTPCGDAVVARWRSKSYAGWVDAVPACGETARWNLHLSWRENTHRWDCTSREERKRACG